MIKKTSVFMNMKATYLDERFAQWLNVCESEKINVFQTHTPIQSSFCNSCMSSGAAFNLSYEKVEPYCIVMALALST